MAMIQDPKIDHGTAFDWGRASKEYAAYRDIYPPAFYTQLLRMGLCTQGQRVLDLGTGTGVLPRHLYPHGASFVGVDISAEQIDEARRLSAEGGMDIEYIVAPAEELDFPADSFDTVTACQCFLYFDAARLLPLLHRVLKPGGALAILSLIWLPGESSLAAASEALVLKHSPQWTGGGFQRRLHDIPPGAQRYGFEAEENIGLDMDISFTAESWNGRMKACRGVAASLPPAEVAAFEQEHLAMLQQRVGDKTFTIPHYAPMLMLRNVK